MAPGGAIPIFLRQSCIIPFGDGRAPPRCLPVEPESTLVLLISRDDGEHPMNFVKIR